MESLNRRDFLAAAVGLPVAIPVLGQNRGAQTTAAPKGMFVSIHQASTAKFDFKASCEGIAKAGVRAVEVDIAKVQEFAQTESLAKAKQLLDDLGLKAVSSSNHLGYVDATPQQFQRLFDQLKTKLEVVQAVGCDRIVCPSTSSQATTPDDFKRGAENMVKGGDLAKMYGVTLMLEFAKTSRLANSIQTALQIVREAKHSNVRVMMDTFHFYGGVGKLEDLELLKDGELAHLHFEDIPDNPPREALNSQQHRLFPGDGTAPLKRTIEILKRKGYSGPASMELFQATTPVVQELDPFQIASRAKAQIEPLIA
ncbi:MAG TPA: sugar phosphate isomerase/epimerase [Terriglobia bacterium]|nr:sugar phosphate isomerase/epimerase [Terriglobia bacterium]